MSPRALTLAAAAGVVGALTLLPVQAASATGFRHTFNSSSEGWNDLCPGGPSPWLSSGGHPGGYIGGTACGQGSVAGALSPAGWAGDRTDAYGGVISFDVIMDEGQTGSLHLEIRTPKDDPSVGIGPFPVDDTWRHYDVRLRATPEWGSNSGPVTKLLFLDALSDVEFVTLPVLLDTNFTAAYFDNITFASTVRRKLTLAYRGNTFGGKLRPAGACAAKQKVTVRRRKPGPDPKVGSDKTSARGTYAIRKSKAARGSYYAEARKGFEKGAGNCLAAKSKGVKVH